MTIDLRLPDAMPVLSRGRHRNPRKGACFMEMASYLAGERWSDHPACTHPLLASLARLVNDHTTDPGRQRLAELIPSVIGLTSDDVRWDALIALRAAETALPVVSAEMQNAMAVSVLSGNRLIAGLDGRPPDTLRPDSRAALLRAPLAARWAHRFTYDVSVSRKMYQRHGAPRTVEFAVQGIAKACIPDPDETLRALLAGAIDDVTAAQPAATVSRSAVRTR
ncbi:hypothetical protein [Phytohabitans houttuyneae]|jgi:hypothetical protein|uniref:Uncharacterized protein n=1 Tax=Phytohabitans houttuyneae TaxID=1076126 RepID=A0A6V8KUA0_9ACTN|nr:hypothetical protein [Phytohabitans houttuyneae]GFJ85397.1 hypothetical protein Phou_095770 [Phytohabitans houttuyneae]